MAKLNGEKELNKKVTKIMRECVGFDDFKCKLGGNWVYYNHKNKVEFTLLENEEQNETWLEWINNRYNFEYDNIIMLSMLHEIGHHVTLNDFILEHKDLWEQELNDEDTITMGLCDAMFEEQKKRLHFAYHSLPAEILATEWAINFWQTYPEKVEKAFKEFCSAAIEFYAANGLDENGNEIQEVA